MNSKNDGIHVIEIQADMSAGGCICSKQLTTATSILHSSKHQTQAENHGEPFTFLCESDQYFV